MRGHLTILGAALVALFYTGVVYSADTIEGYYPNATQAVAACRAASWSGSCFNGNNSGLSGYKWCTEQNGSPNCGIDQHYYLIASACASPNVLNQSTGACEPPPPPPPECDSSANEVYRADLGACGCAVGQAKPFGAPVQACQTPQCPENFYVTYPQEGYYDCSANPPPCPNPVPMCATPPYTCMGESETPTEIPTCDNACPPNQHLSGGKCVQDDEPPVICPPGFQYNLNMSACESSPPIACEPGFKSGTVNGERVCVAATPGTPDNPSKNTGTTTNTTTTTTTTIIYDENGNVVGSSVSSGSSTSNGTIEMDTTGLAQDSTVKGILDTLTGSYDRSGDQWQGGSGTAPTSDNAAIISQKKAELQSLTNGMKADFMSLVPSLAGGGSLACDGGVSLMTTGSNFEICMANHADMLASIGNAVYAMVVVIAIILVLS